EPKQLDGQLTRPGVVEVERPASEHELVLALVRHAVLVLERQLEDGPLDRVRPGRGVLLLERQRGALLLVEDEVVPGVAELPADLVLQQRSAPCADDGGRLQEDIVRHVSEDAEEDGADGTNAGEDTLVQPVVALLLLPLLLLTGGFL